MKSVGTSKEIVIVGGGIVGISLASTLCRTGCSVTVLERHARLFEETSTHNSGVIHAGIYYPPGSRKARTCVEGNALTYAFCEKHSIPHRRCGKLLLAFNQKESAALWEIAERAKKNGVKDVALLSAEDALAREPHVGRPRAALLIPSSGVLDVGEYLRVREREAISAGTQILCNAEVVRMEQDRTRPVVHTSRGEMECDLVIGSAGLWSDELEARASVAAKPVRPCRGEYFCVRGEKAGHVMGLVYPIPLPQLAGLGVHVTPAADGSELLIGPNTKWISRKDDYESGRDGAGPFLESARRLLPWLEEKDLHLAYSGIRPKLVGPGESAADFEIEVLGSRRNFISLRGIESPGLTAAPALAREVAGMVEEGRG